MIEVIEVDSFEQLGEYSRRWNELLQNSETNVVFLTYEYCHSCWEAFGQDQQLLVLLAKKDSEIIGIAPLTVSIFHRFGLKSRVLEFIGTLHSDYLDFMICDDKAAVLEAFYAYLWSIRDRWDVIRLRQIPEDSSTIRISQEQLGKLARDFRVRPDSHCMSILLQEHTEEVLNKYKKDKALRKRINRIKRLGELTFGHAESIEEGLSYLDVFFQQHINRWEPTLTTSVFYRRDEREFYRRLVQHLTPRGWMRLGYLNFDGICIALYFAFEYDGFLSSHRPVYDLFYSRYSPGRIHIRYAVDYCIEKNLKEFDMLAGVEGYKAELANKTRYNQNIHVYKSSLQKFWDQLKYEARKSRVFSPLFADSWIWKLRRNLRKYRRRYGTLGLVKKVIHRLSSYIVDFSSNQLFKWEGADLPAIAAKCPLEIRAGCESDLNQIASFHGFTEDAIQIAALKERLAKGDRPYLAFCGRSLAHIAWVCRRGEVEMEEIWGGIALKDNEAYIMDCKTSFIFRGMNIYPAVLQCILKDLSAEKGKKVYIACRSSNTSSIRGIEKGGFSPAKRIRAVKVFGRKIGAKIIPAG